MDPEGEGGGGEIGEGAKTMTTEHNGPVIGSGAVGLKDRLTAGRGRCLVEERKGAGIGFAGVEGLQQAVEDGVGRADGGEEGGAGTQFQIVGLAEDGGDGLIRVGEEGLGALE